MQSRFLWVGALVALSFGITQTVSAKTVNPAPSSGHSARLTEPSGGFSYVPPVGWHIRTFPGLKYRMSYVMASGFAPNINVVDETAPVPLNKYVQMNLTQMTRVYTVFHVLGQSPFVTSSGLHGIRLASTGTVAGKHVHQIFYLFPAPSSRKIVVTASWLAADGEKYTRAVDGSMKTFALK
jgi:hypothetical protein